MYYTVIKHSSHLRTLEKCRKHSPAARAFYISLVSSNACRVLSQCNTRLRLLYLLSSSHWYPMIHFNVIQLLLVVGLKDDILHAPRSFAASRLGSKEMQSQLVLTESWVWIPLKLKCFFYNRNWKKRDCFFFWTRHNFYRLKWKFRKQEFF